MGKMPLKMYTELDFTFGGLKVTNVDVLITEGPKGAIQRTQD